jgi:hypothetical protein
VPINGGGTMRLVLSLLVLGCTLTADSIPITGSLHEGNYGFQDASVSGPGLSFYIGDPTDCFYCVPPFTGSIGDCVSGMVCDLFVDIDRDSASFDLPAGASYNGISVGAGIEGDVNINLGIVSTGLFENQSSFPVTVSGGIGASVGDQQFLDLTINGTGTASISDCFDEPDVVCNIGVSFTGTATSPVPEPKNVVLALFLALFLVLALFQMLTGYAFSRSPRRR